MVKAGAHTVQTVMITTQQLIVVYVTATVPCQRLLVPRSHPLMRRNGLVIQVKFLGLVWRNGLVIQVEFLGLVGAFTTV